MEAGRWRCQMLQFYIWIISVCVGSRGKVQRVTERTRLLETMNIQLPLHWVSAGRSGSVGPHRSGSDRTGGTGCTAAAPAAAAVMIASCSDGGAAVLWSEVCFLPRRGGETSREALRLHPGSSHCQPPLASLPDQLQSWGHLCLKSLGALKLWRGAATKVHSPVKQTPLANSALISTFVIGARSPEVCQEASWQWQRLWKHSDILWKQNESAERLQAVQRVGKQSWKQFCKV